MPKDSKPAPAAQAHRRPDGPPEKEHLTLREVARWLGVSRNTVWALAVERGELPYLRFSDRVVRVARTDVEEYIRRCRSDSAP